MKVKGNVEHDFDEIKLQFITDWEEGKAPSLQDYLRRYPQFQDQIVDFVMAFVPLRKGIDRMTDSPIPSDSTLRIIEETVVKTSLPVQNLTEARLKMGWSVGQLAQHLNLPNELTLKVVRGYETWTPKIVQKVASLFNLTLLQAFSMLNNTEPVVAAQAKATGQPQPKLSKGKSFQEDLEEFDREGKLTPAQRQEWIEEKD